MVDDSLVVAAMALHGFLLSEGTTAPAVLWEQATEIQRLVDAALWEHEAALRHQMEAVYIVSALVGAMTQDLGLSSSPQDLADAAVEGTIRVLQEVDI